MLLLMCLDTNYLLLDTDLMSNAEFRFKNEEETHPITRMPLLGTLCFVQPPLYLVLRTILNSRFFDRRYTFDIKKDRIS
jgi:hypothetical protein